MKTNWYRNYFHQTVAGYSVFGIIAVVVALWMTWDVVSRTLEAEMVGHARRCHQRGSGPQLHARGMDRRASPAARRRLRRSPARQPRAGCNSTHDCGASPKRPGFRDSASST